MGATGPGPTVDHFSPGPRFFWLCIQMSGTVVEYEEKIVARRMIIRILPSWSVGEIQEHFGCSEPCAKLAKDIEEAEERRRIAEAEERRKDRELQLAKIQAGTNCYRNFLHWLF